jgi:molybdate transport system permease protein
LQVPGQDAVAARMVAVSVVLAMGALFASEVLARGLQRRIGGGDA